MINQESQFKLQAYLDGELAPGEAAQVADWLANDAEAAALLAELSSVKAVFAGNEAEIKLPETREFFWSKIQRQIERESAVEAAPVRKLSWAAWLQRHVFQVSGAALVSCIIGIMAFHSSASATQFGEMELASDQMGAYTFRDQQEGMTMVWFYNHNDDSQFTEDPSVASMETE
jgi:anti-sigma factor RsiW